MNWMLAKAVFAAVASAAIAASAPYAVAQTMERVEAASQSDAAWALGRWSFNWKNVEGGGSLAVWQSSYYGEVHVERDASGGLRATVIVRETGDSTEFVKWSGPASVSGSILLIEGDKMIEESYVGDVKPGLLELTRHTSRVTARIVPALWFGVAPMGGGAQNIDVFR